jgi:alkylation response protein AidB-like acyl-CoA dehydrogenase
MELDLSADQRRWVARARELSRDVLAPNAAAIDSDGKFPRENLKVLGEAGILGLPVSADHGGPGADLLTIALVTEELGRGCASTAMCCHMHLAATALIAAVAEGDQVERFVEPILKGRHISTYAISEPGSGSRWWHMESFVERRDGGYLLDSFKSFATSAGEADSYIVPVRASSTAPHHEYTLLLVDRTIENAKPVGVWDAMGLRGNHSTPMHFDKCFVPDTHRLGEAAFGFPLLLAHGLPNYQVGLAAVYLGIAGAAFDFATAHVTKRVHADTGLPLAKVETIQLYIADMKLRLDQARSFVLDVARYVDRLSHKHGDMLEVIDKPEFLQAVASVKIVATQASAAVCALALQVCGGIGFSRKHPIERYFRDSRAGSVMGPADDILRVLVGQRALGLPYPWE